jgi:hypothetical protein
VGAVPNDGIFFAEVRRPDAVIAALYMAPLLDLGMGYPLAIPQAIPPVARAPRLLRLTRAAIEHCSKRTRLERFRELLSRGFPDLGQHGPRRALRLGDSRAARGYCLERVQGPSHSKAKSSFWKCELG